MASTHGGVFRFGDHEYGYVTITPFAASIPALTPAELAVLNLIRAGHSNQEIAAVRQVSVYTVGNQIAALLKKLGATNRCELVSLVVEATHVAPVSE